MLDSVGIVFPKKAIFSVSIAMAVLVMVVVVALGVVVVVIMMVVVVVFVNCSVERFSEHIETVLLIPMIFCPS